MKTEREQVLSQLEEACNSGARLSRACEIIGLSERTVQRWKLNPEDQRHGPKASPSNKLTAEERAEVLNCANSAEFRDLSPKQIVPALADKGIYIASESTFYRILREEGQLTHRSGAQPPRQKPPLELRATGPNQVYSWDITYIRSPVKGIFYYLYMFIDVWSRKVVGWSVEPEQSAELAAKLVDEIAISEGLLPGQVKLHSDNGGPMKGATMLATLQSLGILASFSRPMVSDDNPYSESLFRTVKYRPGYPSRPFESLPAAREWVESFVDWYNNTHLHSGINFVTPSSRHQGAHTAILEHRSTVYEAAKKAHPERWTGNCRDWEPAGDVVLNGRRVTAAEALKKAA